MNFLIPDDMPDKKLNDKEIVKDFTEKTELIGSMSSVYLDEDKGFELYDAMENILDLINRLQAENEELKDTVKVLRIGVEQAHLIRKDGKSPFNLLKTEIKSEAYKEFAERFNKEAEKVEIDREGDFVEFDNKIYDTVADWCKVTSNNLLKELVGEDNESKN